MQNLSHKKKSVHKIRFTDKSGVETVLKDDIQIGDGEIIDASIMEREALSGFLNKSIEEAHKAFPGMFLKDRNFPFSTNLVS